MKKKYKTLAVIAVPSLIGGLMLCGCDQSGSSSTVTSYEEPTTFNGTDYYDELTDRVSLEEDSDLSFDEKMEGGILQDKLWWVIDGYWDAGGATDWHNGVRARNLRYVQSADQNYLAVKARGSYCRDSDMVKSSTGHIKPEGACIMSQNFLKPGRFEIEMATMPREGAVTAMWTYYSKGSEATSQNEIDIEIGGEGQYTNEWTTTWTTHSNKETDSVDVTPIAYLNDGKIHKYSFDWYTDYRGTGERRVDWFVDGILVKSISGSCVPETAMPLWIGLWCPSWAGSANFIDDYMLIKDIKYTQFDSSSQYCLDARGNPAYGHALPSASSIASVDYTATQAVEKFSNVSFDSLDVCATDSSYFGWTPETASEGSLALSDDHTEGNHSFALTASPTSTDTYHGEYLDQKLTLAYPGYQYAYSIDAKLLNESSEGNLEIRYKDVGGKTLKSDIIPISSTSWKTISGTLTMPAKSTQFLISITSEEGTVLYDNATVKFSGLVA